MSSRTHDDDPFAAIAESHARKFEAGEVFFREGEPASMAFLLEEGDVRLIKRVHGVERSMLLLHPGDLFGELALLSGAECASTAIALTAGVALSVDPPTLERLVANRADIALRVMRQLVLRLRDAEDRIESTMISDTPAKVVNALLKLVNEARRTSSAGAVVALAVSPLDLSMRTGLDVDTVKRTVLDLRAGNYVKIADERIEVTDIDALRRFYSLLGLKSDIAGDRAFG